MSSVSDRGAARVRFEKPRIGRHVIVATVLIALALFAARLSAQQPRSATRAGGTISLSLDDALRIAQAQSEAIEVARAGVGRAGGQRIQARSQMFPQLSATAGYGRTLASQFSGFAASTSPDTAPKPVASQSLCTPFVPAAASAADRAAALAQAATCQSSSGGGFDLSKTSFGAKNQYNVGINFSQNVYTAGRLRAQNDAADAQVRSANIELTAQQAQLSLDVTSAYFDALLADQLVSIADSSLSQTEIVLSQTRVSRQVGNASEYELLRAQVTRDNQLPQRIQAQSNRRLAYLRLKQLLNMPLDDTVRLTTSIVADTGKGPSLPAVVSNAKEDTTSSARASVREADEAIRAQEAQVKIAKSQRIPSLSIVSAYQRLYFPAGTFPTLNAGVNNWTLGLSTAFPVLDGGRIKGDIAVAEANLTQARAQREQVKEFAAFDSRSALTQLQEAEATWEASRGTVGQAERTYAIDEVRYREGISTQTDLSASRLLLEQARANRALAARNLAVARVRLALLRDLPLSPSGSTAPGAAALQQQTQVQQQQRSTTSSNSAARGGTTGGIQP